MQSFRDHFFLTTLLILVCFSASKCLWRSAPCSLCLVLTNCKDAQSWEESAIHQAFGMSNGRGAASIASGDAIEGDIR